MQLKNAVAQLHMAHEHKVTCTETNNGTIRARHGVAITYMGVGDSSDKTRHKARCSVLNQAEGTFKKL